MEKLGFFSELQSTYKDSGTIKNFIVNRIDYDKNAVLDYMSKQRKISICPKEVRDHITNELIANGFWIKTDGEYEWPDSLEYHIAKYNIVLPKEFINKTKKTN